MGGRPVRKIAQGAFPDATVLAVALAQKDRGRRIPVGNGFDVHGDDEHIGGHVQVESSELHGYILDQLSRVQVIFQ